MPDVSRRQLLAAAASAGAAAVAAPAAARPAVCIFSKHLQFLQGRELADAVADLGFPGVDLTVRQGGHVEPERVEAELPPLVEILRQRGLQVPMITSDIVDAATPHAERVIRTIAALGIRHYRWGGFRYDSDRPIPAQLDELRPRVRALAELNARHGVCAMYHTHSGLGQVGAGIWDLHILLDGMNHGAVAVNYDIGHATVEGGFGGWIYTARLTASCMRGVAVKDFVWRKGERGEWLPQWCPLGQGMVRFPQFFAMIAKAGFAGPLQVHYEYPLGGADQGARTLTISRDRLFAAMRGDLALLNSWLRQAGLA